MPRARLPEAQAIVVISAHWLTPGQTHITDAPKNPIIYDFGGFPAELSCDPGTAALVSRRWKEYFPQGGVEMGDSEAAHLD